MKILLIGCGKMGSAMLGGWLDSGIARKNVLIVDPFADVADVKEVSQIGDFKADYVIIAVKPQMINDEFLAQLSGLENSVYISIAAGKRTAAFKHAKTLRAMPNLPALIGEGATGLFANWDLAADEKTEIEKLFSPLGKYIWVGNEELIDSVTSVSGSGPAYVFLFLDALKNAGIEGGLTEEAAIELALQTVIGTANMAAKSDLDLVTLKENVTSKGGTTAAALDVFEDGDALRKLVGKAVAAAKKRGEELSI